MNFLLKGSLKMILDDEFVHLAAYDSLVVPPDVEHPSQATNEQPLLLAIWSLPEDRLDVVEY